MITPGFNSPLAFGAGAVLLGTVFLDSNSNGIQDNGEPPYATAVVTCSAINSNGGTTPSTPTTSNGNGNVVVSLPPGGGTSGAAGTVNVNCIVDPSAPNLLGTGSTSYTVSSPAMQSFLLISGGNGDTSSNSSEMLTLIDGTPTGQWTTLTNNINHATHEAAVLTSTGASLPVIIGGTAAIAPGAEFETGEGFSTIPSPMAVPARSLFKALTLANSTVLAIGGFDNGAGAVVASCEQFSEQSFTWSAAPALSLGPRANFNGVQLNSGRFLVAGGIDANFNRLSSAEVYDSLTPGWSATGVLAAPLISFGMAALDLGPSFDFALVAGGLAGPASGANATAAVQLWTGGDFLTVSYMANSRQGLELLPLQANACIGSICVGNSGGAIAIGGANAAGDTVGACEIYNYDINEWTTLPGGMTVPRAFFRAVMLPNGDIVASGCTLCADRTSVEILSATSGTWAPLPNTMYERWQHTMVGFTEGLHQG